MREGPARDGKVHVLAEQCETCIFRPGNLMNLERGRVAGMVRECKANESAITCHDTLPYGRFGKSVRPAICRGYFDAHGDQVWSIRLARAMGLIVEDPVPTEEEEAK